MQPETVVVHYADTEGRVHGELRIVIPPKPPAGAAGCEYITPVITLDGEEFLVSSLVIEYEGS